MVKTRTFKESNYHSVFFNGKTIRIPIDPKKPITELKWSEFYDVKVTNTCNGMCPYCYMDSKIGDEHYDDSLNKIKKYFGKMSSNEKPYQIAYGGGEPTLHPQFIDIIKATYDMEIMPNYTTNGTRITEKLLNATKKYCGGVAVSTHEHLDGSWNKAVKKFIDNGINTNLHIIISDKKSVDRFLKIYKKYGDKIYYYVLLPYTVIGRAKPMKLEFDYLFGKVKEMKWPQKIAYGARFYEQLKKIKAPVSMYEPEIMSKFLDLKDMKLYKSSFESKPIN